MSATGGSLLVADAPTPDEGRSPSRATASTTDPPRAIVWICAAVVVAGVVMALVGAVRTGVSWDEPYHVMRLRNFFDYGWYSVNWSVDSGGDATADSNTLVYGPVAMLLLHGLGVLLGFEPWGTVSTTPEAYAVRHVGVALIGLVGTAAAAATTRIVLGTWRWGLVTAAALLALPMWTGHLMFNIKDVPVATGYALVTLALVAMVDPAPQSRKWRMLALFGGTLLMVGTRPAMISALLGAVAILLVGALVLRPRTPLRTRSAVTEIAVSVGAAYGMLIALYPGLYAHPLRLVSSTEQATSFRNGEQSERLYILFHLVAQFPIILQACAVLGLVCVVRAGWAGLSGRSNGAEPAYTLRLALVVAQVGALPVVAMVQGSDLYNGLRQLLFATPAWAVLVTLGIAHVIARARARGRLRAATVALAVGLIAPIGAQLSLFPYQYSYWNAALDVTGVHVQSDYWRTSIPELLPHIPDDGQIVCSPTRATSSGELAGTEAARALEQTEMVAGRYSIDSSVDCRLDPLGPLAHRWRATGRGYESTLASDQFYAVIDRDHGVPSNCTRLASVDRIRHGREVSMTYVARCESAVPALQGTVDFARVPGGVLTPEQWAYAPEGWEARRSSGAIDALGRSATLAFGVPPTCGGCALVLDADVPYDLQIRINGVAITPQPLGGVAGGAVVAAVPADITEATVVLTRTSGRALDVQLRSFRVQPTDSERRQ